MKSIIITAALSCLVSNVFAGNEVSEESIDCKVARHYKYRSDKSAGREMFVTYNGIKPLKNASIEILANGKKERTLLNTDRRDSISVLLPPDIGVRKDDTISVNFLIGKKQLASKQVVIPYARQWTVYIYPHSHVDIGYTNTQANVELIHKRNLEYAIELAEKTKNYPEGARFVWNPEVTWPVERYLKTEPAEKCEKLIRAIKDGQIAIDAGYVNTNTSTANDEELFELFNYSKKLEKRTGRSIKTMVQVDIPGVSWGVVPVASQLGIPYCLALFNGSDRTGLAHEISFKPFWWEGPDGKSKMLFLQPGAYTPGAHNKGYMFWPKMAGQTDPDKLLKIVKTDNPRANFIDKYIDQMLPELEKADYYPFDIFPMTWCMADNTPIDFDLPEAVKSWNEEFAYPKLRICTATEMMSAFDEKYGDQLPVLKGDFTECWTDGLGSKAGFTGHHREVKEQLVQTETLWSMLKQGSQEPLPDFEEAWRNVIMGTEHTWAYMNPSQQPICDEILNVKLDYFRNSDKMQRELLAGTLSDIITESATVSLFNTSSWVRSEVVKLPKEVAKNYTCVVDAETGKEVVSQCLSDGRLAFWAADVDALGAKKYRLSSKPSKRVSLMRMEENVLDNGIVKLKVSPETGDVISLVYGGEEFADNKSMSALNSYRYLKGDDEGSRATKAYNVKVSVKERGPLVNSLLVESDAEGCSELKREIILVAGQPYVSFCNILDKIATTDKEGIHFGFAFDIKNPVINADIPWGVMEVEKDQLAVANRNWIAFQRWLNISGEDKNVTWCSLNACMFEVGEMSANIIGGAFKSPKWIRKIKPSSTIYSWALNNHWHTNFPLSQDGKIKFEYRVLPGKGAYDVAKANKFGMEQICPMVAVPVDKDFNYQQNMTLTGDESVVVSMIKTIDDGKSQIVRLRSVSDKEHIVKLAWKKQSPKRITVCEFNEEPGKVQIVDGRVPVSSMGFTTLRLDW